MGIVETWMREKPIRTFLAQFSTRRAAAGAAALLASSSAAAASADGEPGDRSIQQLSSIANSVVSRCSRYAVIRFRGDESVVLYSTRGLGLGDGG